MPRKRLGDPRGREVPHKEPWPPTAHITLTGPRGEGLGTRQAEAEGLPPPWLPGMCPKPRYDQGTPQDLGAETHAVGKPGVPPQSQA